jgi:hypothetical protein
VVYVFHLGRNRVFSQFAEGATQSLWLIGAIAITEIIIFILAIFYGMGGMTKRDIWRLAGAGFALLLWFLTKNAAPALYLVISIDGIATVLTMVKVYEHPMTETYTPWILTGVAGLFSLAAIGRFSLILMTYPFYTLVINFVVVAVILLARRKIVQSRKS